MSRETPLAELHRKAGATLATWFDCLLPERFDDVAAECRRAREAVALVDTNYHAFAYLDGPDRVRYLNALLTNNIKDLAPGQGNVSLLLNPQGHILAEIESFALPERLLAVWHAKVREATLATLEKFIIMDDVTLDDATDRIGSLAVEGPRAASLLHALSGVELEAMQDRAHVEAGISGTPCRIVRKSHDGETGAEVLAELAALPALWAALAEATRKHGGGPIGYVALNVLRLEAGIPWFGYDFDEKVIPHEAALEASHISFTKGCYTGQEIVERVRSRGHVNRRRVRLEFSGASVPAPGEKLSANSEDVGYVTSAARSPLSGRVLGMGYARSPHTTPGSRLDWSGGTAEVVEPAAAGVRRGSAPS